MDKIEYVIDRVAECMIGFSFSAIVLAVLIDLNTYLSGVGI